jgi:hypothetical protein
MTDKLVVSVLLHNIAEVHDVSSSNYACLRACANAHTCHALCLTLAGLLLSGLAPSGIELLQVIT